MKYIGIILVILFTISTTLILVGQTLHIALQVAMSVMGVFIGVGMIVIDKVKKGSDNGRNNT